MQNSFSERLSTLLNEKRITQKELSDIAGVTEAAVSHYVKGDRIPRASVLAKIAEALDTSSDFLMNGTATNSKEEIGIAVKLIARNSNQMSKEDKIKIISILLSDDKLGG